MKLDLKVPHGGSPGKGEKELRGPSKESMGQKAPPAKEENKAPEIKMDRNVGEQNPSKLIAELAPGKKGGDFELPFGGKISIESGLLGKKDIITCCMISPSDRYKYLPPLRSDEHLLSEIFLLATSVKSLKRNLHLKLPFYPENFDLFDLQLLWRPPDSDEWMNKEFTKSDSGRFVEFATLNPGIYVVTSHPRRERFVIPVNGCLFNSKLSHQISVRFAKKATDIDIQCDIQISPMNHENLAYLRQDYPNDMNDLITASDFVEVRPQVQREFRRPVTIKLPLPLFEQENFPQEDLAVMHLTPQGWDMLDVPLKITKSSVSFETKTLTKYCVALARPQRVRRLKEAFKHMGNDVSVTRGEILSFLHLQEKLWTLWFECVPNEKKEAVMAKRSDQGFIPCKKAEIIEQDDDDDKPAFRKNWRSRSKPTPKKLQRTDLDFINGQSFDLNISGDIKVSDEDGGQKNTKLYFLDRLPENYRKFIIEPVKMDVEGKKDQAAFGHLQAMIPNPEDESGTKMKSIAAFTFEADPAAVKAYYYVEPEPEPEPPTPTPPPEVEEKPDTPPPPPPVKKDTGNSFSTSFMRLIKPTKPPRLLIKESKVMTGRSLMNLAREVDQGLTLAIHLDISDSTITGMGFDAIASGLNLIDITYRILMLWKRRTTKLKGHQPEMLASALEEMGRSDLAKAVMEHHKDNREIMPDSFDCMAEKVATYNNGHQNITISY